MRTVLDACVLIAATEPTDPHHRSAVLLMKECGPGAMTIHPLTLSEVLVGGVRQGRGHALRSAIAAAGVTTESGDLVDPLILAEVRAHTSLSMPDAVVLASARALGAALATFDDRLRSRAAEAGLTVRPEA